MSGLNLVSALGCVALPALAWLAGGCRRPVPWRTALGSAGVILGLGVLVFWVPYTRNLLVVLNDVVLALLGAGNQGAEFLFGPLAVGPGGTTAAGEPSIGFVLATNVLPAVIFFASLMGLLYHLGWIQPVVRLLGRAFHRSLELSGAEALAGGANVFFGVESATTVRPYLGRMTRSELLTVLTCGMCTVASTTLAIYVLFLRDTFPRIAGHLISASVLSIPAAALISKLMLPETEQPETRSAVPPVEPATAHGNWIAALAAGAWDGLKLAAGIATLLIAVLGLVGIVDLGLERATGWTLAGLLGWVFAPLAWLLGIESADVLEAGRLLGQRFMRTEVVAYRMLADLSAAGTISPRSVLVMSYALCGFSHVASTGIFVGGFAALAPERRDDLAALGPRALAASTLATLLTGAVAGMLYFGDAGVLG